MAEHKEIYADGVSNIHWCGNMVKIDLVSYNPQKDGGAPVPEICNRLVIPPNGLLTLADSVNELLKKLAEAGVLQRTDTPKL